MNKTNFNYRITSKYLLIIFVSLWIFACANPGMPTGGAKDEEPPKVVKSEPENFSKNFKAEKIKIYFDEYVVQKNLSQQLLISPPMEEKPDIEFKGKYVQIKLNCELYDSTTYTINFGDAIVDNNEGNPLKDFQFVFATGDKIDSLQVGGILKDAKTDAPKANSLVMLYRNMADSTPYNELPVYIGRTGKSGHFQIRNIADTDYKLFALEDNNQNYLFDQPTEDVAFIDSIIRPYAELRQRSDTIQTDTLGTDSIIFTNVTKYYPDSIMLNMFEEIYFKQYLTTKERFERNQLILAFNESLSDSFSFEPLNFELNENNHILDVSAENDSIIYWLKDTMISNLDSLLVKVRYLGEDSIKNPEMKTDTIVYSYREKKKKKGEEKPIKLVYSLIPKKVIEMNEKLEMIFEKPLGSIDTSKISLTVKQDTLNNKMPYAFIADSIDIKKYYIDAKWEFANDYELSFDSLAFVSFDGIINDSTGYRMKTNTEEYYGKIIVNLYHPFEHAVLLLLSEKGVTLREIICTESGKYELSLLDPKSFKLRLIDDKNKNGKWDTGNYLQKLQAEKVYNYSEVIKVKANWEMEIDWEIEEQE